MDEVIYEMDECEMDAIGEAEEILAAQDEYENRPVYVQCGTCGIPDTGPAMRLESVGWKLVAFAEYCPSH